MSCPHFEPVAPLAWPSWRGSLRPPLGIPYDGFCRAGERFRPTNETLAEKCNMGYAAGCCPHFRSGAGDAVRFSIGPAATVRWLVVSGALPEQSGEVPLDEVDGETVLPGIPSIISTQLKAYVAAFRESRQDR